MRRGSDLPGPNTLAAVHAIHGATVALTAFLAVLVAVRVVCAFVDVADYWLLDSAASDPLGDYGRAWEDMAAMYPDKTPLEEIGPGCILAQVRICT